MDDTSVSFLEVQLNEFDAPDSPHVALHFIPARQAGFVCNVFVCQHIFDNPASQHVLISFVFGFYKILV